MMTSNKLRLAYEYFVSSFDQPPYGERLVSYFEDAILVSTERTDWVHND